jgi:hypothetical protein
MTETLQKTGDVSSPIMFTLQNALDLWASMDKITTGAKEEE